MLIVVDRLLSRTMRIVSHLVRLERGPYMPAQTASSQPGQELGCRGIPAVEVHGFGEWTATDGAVPALRPTHDDMPRKHPILGYSNGIPQQLFPPVRTPACETCAQAQCPGGQQKVLHRWEDRSSEKKFGGRGEALLGKQDRGELAGP